MTDAISESEYREKVESMAEYVASDAEGAVDEGQYDEFHQAVFEFAEEDVQYDNWFARDYYDGALYGSIVEHSWSDTAEYNDWFGLIETNEPLETLKRLALVCMEADVIDTALDQ